MWLEGLGSWGCGFRVLTVSWHPKSRRPEELEHPSVAHHGGLKKLSILFLGVPLKGPIRATIRICYRGLNYYQYYSLGFL